ncbi:Uncharacterized protein dnm_072500 [Desulfonema magnum]|uniref:Uncharacterized protein n=1 Tax=Desulfonema magnum TaxID=45655 RepID=A0A975GRQ9_9BACT|nr:Uncharacterized protein dnm_072500 [Desulfonema magnum]
MNSSFQILWSLNKKVGQIKSCTAYHNAEKLASPFFIPGKRNNT